MYRIAYFIGAGLTKSLQTSGSPVPMMWDFVPTMAHYLQNDAILAAMVELERADLFEWKSAEAERLAGEEFPPDRAAFKRALENRPAESIEDLLERSLGPTANFSAQGTHQRFKYAINQLFCMVGWKISWAPLERFLQNQFRKPDTEHTFISFNYDLVLDHAVQRCFVDWGPATGYGMEIPFYVTDDLPVTEKHAGPAVSVPATRFAAAPTSPVRILKPHGSLNWLVPYGTPYEQSPEGLRLLDHPVIIPITPEGEIRYWPSSHTFQAITLPRGLPTDIGICILPPSSAKRSELPFLKLIRNSEMDTLADADEVFVIGWSIPETDLDQFSLIKTAVESRSKPLKRITIVNRGAPTAYFKRLTALFGSDPNSLHVYNAGFTQFASTL
jgi:hypothetical protein